MSYNINMISLVKIFRTLGFPGGLAGCCLTCFESPASSQKHCYLNKELDYRCNAKNSVIGRMTLDKLQ